MSLSATPHDLIDPKALAFCLTLSKVAAILACLVAAGAVFASLHPGPIIDVPVMNGLDALAVTLSGLTMFRFVQTTTAPGRRATVAAGFLVSAAGLAPLIAHAAGVNPDLDRFLLFSEYHRTSFSTTLCVVLTGLSIVTLNYRWKISQALTLFVACLCEASLIAYQYGLNESSGAAWIFTTVARGAARGLLLVSLGLLLSRPARGPVAILTSPTVAGDLTRRLVPWVLFAPATITWLLFQGELRGFYNSPFVHAMSVTADLILLTGVVFAVARTLARKDAERRRTAATYTRGRIFETLLESVPDAIIIADAAGKIVQVNAAAERLFGYSGTELIGRPATTLSSQYAEGVGMPAGPDQGMFGTGKDGILFPAEISRVSIETDDGTLMVSAVRDITERRLEQAETARLAAIVDSSEDAIIVRTAEGAIMSWNHGAEVIYGYSAAEVVGGPISVIIGPERTAETELILQKIRGGARIDRYETVRRRKDGQAIAVSLTLSPIRDSAGRLMGISSVSRDVTARRIKDALAARTEEMERFTYAVSHDLKSPLITIKGFVGMVEKDVNAGNTGRALSDLRRIASAADKMHRMLGDLLALSRAGRLLGRLEEVPFTAVVAEALEMISGSLREKSVVVEVEPEMPAVSVDRLRMVEVIQNLVENSIKFMASQSAPRIQIGCRRVESETRFFVKDNGVGVDPKHHERIFGLFEKLNPEAPGSGLGLALVKQIVAAHGGRIWVESSGSGQGATMWFTVGEVAAAGPEGSRTLELSAQNADISGGRVTAEVRLDAH